MILCFKYPTIKHKIKLNEFMFYVPYEYLNIKVMRLNSKSRNEMIEGLRWSPAEVLPCLHGE